TRSQAHARRSRHRRLDDGDDDGLRLRRSRCAPARGLAPPAPRHVGARARTTRHRRAHGRAPRAGSRPPLQSRAPSARCRYRRTSSVNFLIAFIVGAGNLAGVLVAPRERRDWRTWLALVIGLPSLVAAHWIPRDWPVFRTVAAVGLTAGYYRLIAVAL